MLTALTLTAALASCAPSATPTPTPSETGFASEAEAFAAAEETYRAYVDALNDVDLSDPATFEPVYALLEGEALGSEKKGLSEYHSQGLTVSGATEIRSVDGVSWDPDSAIATLATCIDVSDVDVRDAEGQSQVSDGRPDLQRLTVQLIDVPGAGLQIEEISSRSDGPEC